jgi:thymidylate kinase
MKKVREGFLYLCESEGERMVLIDGGFDVDVIADSIRSITVAGLSSHVF